MSERELTVGGDRSGASGCLSPEAFALLFTEHGRLLWCIAAGVLGRPDQADDVLQEGAMIALRKLEQFEPGSNFTAWMGRIVRFVALNHARRHQRAPIVSVDPVTMESLDRDPRVRAAGPVADPRGEIDPEQASFDDDVMSALGGLEEMARACVVLRTVMDLPYREIALALDIPEGTAMSHVHRARRTLRKKLHEHEGAARAPGGSS